MSPEIIYLEFSDVSDNSHKFYEVSVQEETVKIRFGRINTKGTTQTKTYLTSEQAQKEAIKKIKDKQRKGYQIITNDTLEEPPVILSQFNNIQEEKPPSNLLNDSPINTEDLSPLVAPIRWLFDSGWSTFGIAVDADHCWLGNEKGHVFKLDHQGHILQKYQLPDAVKCIVVDDIWIYVGCDNGNVYDLTGKFPYLAYEIEKGVEIFWLDIYDGVLGISDANGGLTKTDPEGEILWNRLSHGKMGWMLCFDAQNFYHGHSKGVTTYDSNDGRQIWYQPTVGKVLFGCQKGERLYVATSGKKVQCFHKNGSILEVYSCEASVYACTTDEQENYIFASDSSAFIYCFNQSGQRLWKVSTGCGSALSIKFFQGCLYIVTNQGIMACLDVSLDALKLAQSGNSPIAFNVSQSSITTHITTTLETISSPSQGVILECFRQGQNLRIRPITEGYHQDWMVQFPRDLRQEGEKYWVQELKEAKQGGFYRIYGEIKRVN